MIYNFRIDRTSRPEILEVLANASMLSQGWAGEADPSLDLRNDDFASACKRHYGMKTTRIPTNLKRIRDFKKGDMIVVPHLPRDGTVSLHMVAADFPEGYDHVPDAKNHLGHRIRVERSYGLDGQISIHNHEVSRWYAKLAWMRLPILPIARYKEEFERVKEMMDLAPNLRLEPSELDEHLNRIRDQLLERLRSDLAGFSPSMGKGSFEAVCQRLVEASGYEVQKRHIFDGKGGDIDFLCTRQRSAQSPFEGGDSTLLVQVKKHEGISDEYAVEQLLGMMPEDQLADRCVMSLAPEFSPRAEQLAASEGVKLLNGKDVCLLLLKYLAGDSEALQQD